MRIGYPCLNNSIGCTASRTFRLRSYSPERLLSTVKENLLCLKSILEFNNSNGFLFFRIGSELVPFASHEICNIDWQSHFIKELKEIGKFVKNHHMRVSMHPDQFVIINAKDSRIVKKSIRELEYHTEVLDLMGLDRTAKIQIHAGGVYNDKDASIKRFIESYHSLNKRIKNRLVIENDDHLYSVNDCLKIHNQTAIPVLFDSFHHEIFNNGESLSDALKICALTWKKIDGPLMVDYSSQSPGGKKGAHTNHIDKNHFLSFLKKAGRIDFDLMLEIKDKEKSAEEALKIKKTFCGN
jgi:UV DNA damage endonuclease